MTDHVPIMVIAVIVAVTVMLLAADPLAALHPRNPTVVMLALGFLLMIGMTLIAEGFGAHVPKGYIYAAMAFSAARRGPQHARAARAAEADQAGRGAERRSARGAGRARRGSVAPAGSRQAARRPQAASVFGGKTVRGVVKAWRPVAEAVGPRLPTKPPMRSACTVRTLCRAPSPTLGPVSRRKPRAGDARCLVGALPFDLFDLEHQGVDPPGQTLRVRHARMVTHDSPLRRKALLSARFRQGKGEPKGRAGQGTAAVEASGETFVEPQDKGGRMAGEFSGAFRAEVGAGARRCGSRLRAARAENEAGPPCGTASRDRQ